MQPTPDTELTLTRADLSLVVSPYGASLRGLFRVSPDGSHEEIITGYSGAQGKVGGQGDVLIPFPGRVAQGRYTFEGQTYEMEKNDKEGPNAIHGFLRQTLWEMGGQTQNAVTFQTDLAAHAHSGYPFSLAVSVTYRLTAAGFECAFEISNTGNKTAPVAAGFHPYFTVGSPAIDVDTLHLPFASYLEFENLIPTGSVLSVAGSPLDFRWPRPIGSVPLNTCYADPRRDTDGLVRLRLIDSETHKSVTVWMDAAFDYVVLYSGDPLPESHRRRALAIEPMTCGADAFNHPEWGLTALEPTQTLSGRWGVTAG